MNLCLKINNLFSSRKAPDLSLHCSLTDYRNDDISEGRVDSLVLLPSDTVLSLALEAKKNYIQLQP